MGRQASIDLNDVKSAREQLIAANKPHGIIAIRRQIGRGSPQLIAKLLRQIDDEYATTNNSTRERKVPVPNHTGEINRAWRRFSGEVEGLLERTKTTPAATRDSQPDERRLHTLEQLVSRQQQQLERLETLNHNLEEQLMQQQDLFDSWWHEQQAERQMLRNQLDQLARLTDNKPPVRRKRKRGTQLDLYEDNDS